MAWIFLNDAFLSIVDPLAPLLYGKGLPHKGGVLLVRSRTQGDIERVFPGAQVEETPHRDYRFRTTLPRAVVAAAIAERIMDATYGNFKSSVKENDRHDAYLGVWSVMNRWQQRQFPARFTFDPWDRAEDFDLGEPLPFSETLEAKGDGERRGCKNGRKARPTRRKR